MFWENKMKFPQKIKSRTKTWSSNSTSAYLFRGNEIINLKSYLHSLILCIIIYNNQISE